MWYRWCPPPPPIQTHTHTHTHTLKLLSSGVSWLYNIDNDIKNKVILHTTTHFTVYILLRAVGKYLEDMSFRLNKSEIRDKVY